MSADDSFREARARARARGGMLSDAAAPAADDLSRAADAVTSAAAAVTPAAVTPAVVTPADVAATPSPAPTRPASGADAGKRAIEEIGLLAAAVVGAPMSIVAVLRNSVFTPEVSVGIVSRPAVIDQLCAEVVTRGAPLVIDDLHADPRLRDLLGGIDTPELRFYVGVPLVSADGEPVGVLSVMDAVKRTLDPLQEELLGALGRMAAGVLEPGRSRSGAVAPGPALLAASVRLKGLLEHADALICIKNAQGRFVLANRALERLLGRKGGMLGALESDLLPSEIAHEHLANDAKVLAEGSSMVFEEHAPHPDGTVHDFVSTKFPLPDAEGRMSLVGAISVDVTELKRARVELAAAERARRDSEQRFALAFDQAPSGMAVIALRGPDAGRFLRVNRALCQMTGYTEHDLLGKSVHALGHPEDRREAVRALARLGSGEQTRWEVEQRYRHADGHDVWVHVSDHVATDVDWANAYVVSHIQDITPRKQAVAWLADPSPSTALLRGADAVMSQAQARGAAGD